MNRARRVDRAHDTYAGLLTDPLVVLAEPGGEVHYPRTLLGGDEVGRQHHEGPRLVGEEVEQGAVGKARQLGPLERGHQASPGQGRSQVLAQRLQAGLGDDVAGLVGLHHGVGDVRAYGESQVGGQGPGRRRPHQGPDGEPGPEEGLGRVAGPGAESSKATVTAGSWRGR